MNNPDASPSTVKFNVIPLKLDLGPVTFSFYKERKVGVITAPLQPEEMPPALRSQYGTSLYTDFNVHSNAPETSEIDLERNHNFAKHYLNKLIYNWFEGKARLRRRNFVNQNEFYFRKQSIETKNIAVFDRYIVNAGFGQVTDGAELTVTYNGKTRIWLNSVLKYPGSTKDINYVAYKGHIYRYKYFFKGRKNINREEVFPVINTDISLKLNLAPSNNKIANKVKYHTLKINEFYNRFITSEEFIEQFQPAGEGYLSVDASSLKRISPDAANLEFGDGKIDKNPHQGMKVAGPYQPPETPHFKLFFIVSERDKPTANNLFKNLRDGLGTFPGINQYAQIPIHFDENHIIFRNTENPFPEIQNKLKEMTFDTDIQYGAIYISPISKSERNEKKFRVYYKLKEELLNYRITSQFIYYRSIKKKGFSYYLPNISVALLAKLGGIPWTLQQKAKKELVIGIGAYSPYRFRKTYLGSAFCFSNRGEFQGFNSFAEKDNLMLAGSFQRAIRHFRKQNNEVERIIIHFYKKMSKKESDLLLNALKEMNLDVPIVILTIHKSGSSDFVLTDTHSEHGLPLSGTYVRSGDRQFLLCNNTRYTHTEISMRSYPLPLKIYFDMAGGNEDIETKLDDDQWVYELLEQVYQFSRLNWKSISIKSLPVTILYPELVAEKFPYFTSNSMPEFGRRNFWFL